MLRIAVCAATKGVKVALPLQTPRSSQPSYGDMSDAAKLRDSATDDKSARLPFFCQTRVHDGAIRRQRSRGILVVQLVPISICRVPPTTRMGALALPPPAPSLLFEDRLVPKSSEIAPGNRSNGVNLNSHSRLRRMRAVREQECRCRTKMIE
jgi:hypothetical protein